MPLLTGIKAVGAAIKGAITPTTTPGRLVTTAKATAAAASRSTKNYNVVVVVLDDVGLEKFASYASQTGNETTGAKARIPNIKTHVIDRGITFNQFYNCPVCGTTRACADTELYVHHHGQLSNILNNTSVPGGDFYVGQDPSNLSDRSRQMIQCLPHAIRNGRPKNVYRLCKIGKSHMQQNDNYTWPNGGEGWSEFYGHLFNLSSHYLWDYVRGTRDLVTGAVSYTLDAGHATYGPERELIDMEAFLDDVGLDNPFVLWWCPSVGHSPYQSPPTTGVGAIGATSQADWTTAFSEAYPSPGTNYDNVGSSDPVDKAKRVMAQKHQIESVDDVFGDLVAKLIANGQYDDTVFIVFSDNGTDNATVAAPFDPNHGKRFVYAQGVRCPLWIGGALCGDVPRASNDLVNIVDIGSTIREICKVYTAASDADQPPIGTGKPRDGRSFLAHMKDPAKRSPRSAVAGTSTVGYNFTMIGGPYAGGGWDAATKRYVSPPTQGSYALCDGTYTLLRLAGATPTEKMFLATDFTQPDSNDLLVISASDPVIIAARARMSAALTQILAT